MKGKSYKVLEEFKKALSENGFVSDPARYGDWDIARCQGLLNKYETAFFESLCEDLNNYCKVRKVKLLGTIFIPEDEDAQGATICHLYTEFADWNIKVTFRYLVFQGAISYYLTDYPKSDLRKELERSSNKFISALARNYGSGTYPHLGGL